MRLKHLLSVFLTLLTLSVGQVWGVQFSFTSAVSGWPTTESSEAGGSKTYTVGSTTYTFSLGPKVYCSSGYLMLKYTTYLGLPAISGQKLTGVTIHNSSGCSTSSKVTITAASNSSTAILGGALKTLSTTNQDYTWTLTGTSANTMYYLYISNKNCQITSITCTYEAVSSCTNPTTALSVSSSASATVGTPMTLTTANGNGGPVTWEITSGGDKATLDGATLTPTAEGSVTVKATQDDYTTGGKTYCGGNASRTITITKAPATITLSELGATSSVSGSHYGGDSYTLPTSSDATCTGKKLVGWSTVEIDETDTKPTSNFYAKGETVTLAAGSNTFYAVFAAGDGGTLTVTRSDVSTSGTGYAECTWTVGTISGKVNLYKNTTSYIQIGGSNTPHPYNSTQLPAAISKITITMYSSGTCRTWTPRVSASAAQSTTSSTGGTNLTGKTFSAAGTSLVWDVDTDEDYRYFYLSSGGNTNIASFEIEYGTYSKYATSCCTELGSIKGSVSFTNGEATVSFDDLADVTGWGLKYKKTSDSDVPASWSTYSDSFVEDNGTRSNSTAISGLVAESQYDFKVTGTYNGSNYCTGAFEATLDPTTSYYVPKMEDPSVSSITNLGYIVGAASSTAQSFTISVSHLTGDLTVTAPDNFQVSKTGADANDFASTATLTQADGTKTVWVRLATGLAENTYGGNTTYVTITGGGAAGKQVSVTGVVGPACHNPSISGSLSDATYNLNAEADALTITATKGDNSDPDLTYQWLQCTSSDGTYVNAVGGTGATTNSYTPPTTTAGSDLYYKCKVNSGNCFDYSGIAHIQVNTPVIKLNDATSNINLAFGDRAVDATTGYTETFTVSGQYLGADISIAKNGTNEAMFTLSASSVTKQNDGTASTTITVTYKPSAVGEHSATLTLSSAQATSRTVSLSGTGKWLVTWNVADQEDPFTNLAADGGKPTLPTPAPANNTLGCANAFMGWSAKNGGSVYRDTEYYDDLFSDAEHAPAISEATPFYAVFATSEDGTEKQTFTPGTDTGETSVTKGNATCTMTTMDNASYYQIFANQSGTFTCSSGNITKIEFTCTASGTSKYGPGNASANVGTYSYDGTTGTWTGSASPVTISSTAQVRMTSLKVTYESPTIKDYVTECPAVEAPTFSPAAGEYHEAKDVTISCATVGYDEIRYTTDGTDPTKTTGTVYSSAITVDETTTIKAIAVKGDNVSDVVSATYTITYPRKVTFDAGAGTLSIAPATSLTEEAYGEGITLPSAIPSSYCVAEGWTFAGWATTNSMTTAPTIVSGIYTPESDITLYAVYKLGDENYHLVTELPTGEDIPGNYMIVNTANAKAMDAFVKSDYYLDQDATGTITDNTIIPANVTYFNYNHWTVTYESSKWIFYNEYQKQYLYNYCNDGTHHNVGITESKPNGYSIELSEGFAVFTSADDAGAHIWYDATHSDFAGTTSTTNNLHLYKQATATYSSTPACCNDEVTVSKADNPSTGTFTLDKSGVLSTCAGSQVVTVTCVPNAGYHVDAVTETIETDVTIEETEENVYTVTYAKNVSGTSTISVTFAETLTPSFQISQNAFEIGDVAVEATVQPSFTISAAHLEGTSLSITSSNDKFTVSPASLTIKDDGSVEEATVTVTLNTAEANIGGPYSTTITLADGATTPNTATVNLTNATIKNQYNVKWYNGTTLLSEADYLDGATISDIPTAASCDPSISHVGWLPNATISGKQADAPAGLVANEDIPAVTADVEYHAVFAKVGEASWRNTALADLTSEDIFVIAETTGSYALSSANGTSSAPAAPSITITDGKITSEVTAAMKWNVSGNATDGYTFYPNGSTSTWLYCNNSNNGVRIGTSDNKVFTIYSGYLKNTATNRYVGVYVTNDDWRCYESCTGQSNIAGQSFGYFKYIAPTIKDYMTTCAVTFTATYEAGAGTGDDYEDASLIEKNADYIVLGNDMTDFSKTDYRFNGWKCGDDDYAAGATYENVTADLTFVAQWIEKEEAGLEYATSAYEVIQNGSFTKPTLTNPHDLAVTYSSSNESVATVDAEGNVTLVTDAIGSTVITATSEATDTYKAGEATYTLSVASKWALTYTSNVALVENSDTKASSATVNGYDAMKCGTTGVAGAMQITVPKNTEKLHIHAVGWKDESVTISITGATVSPNSINLTADNAISGSGSSFTLSKPSTFYKEISLSNITEAMTLTLEATNGKRFVVYGVNEEGGIWELPSDDANESAIPDEVNVVVSEDQSLTITNAKTLNNLTVEAGGTVSGSAQLNVQDLTINSQSGKSGQVTGTNVQVSGDIYLEIKLDASGTMDPHKWYCISAPFAVAAFEWGDGTPMVFNVDYQLFKYDGEKRANTGNGWQRVGGTMEANTAYFIGFDDENPKNQNVIRLKAANNTIPTAEAMNLSGHDSENDGDKNWYGLGNPALQYVGVNMTAHVFTCEVQGYDVIPHWSTDFNGFVVGSAFFVQGTGVLSFDNAASAYHAPKRQVEEYTYCVEISKEGASRYDNRIFVRASEDAESTFVQGKDEYTLNNTTSNYGALLWTENYGGKRLAIEEAPLVNGTASYVLTLSAPKAGTYSISVAAPQDNADLYLTYEGTIIWNLSEGAYTMDLNKGITNGYGLILRAKVPSVVTGVDQIDAKADVQKVIIDEHVYILRGGQMYDVNGKMVK